MPSTTSEKQIAANRRNALQSTGPRSPEGKSISALNALTHGLSSSRPDHPFESTAEFFQFRDAFMAQLNPSGPIETFLASRVAATAWRLRRVVNIEREIFWHLGVYADQEKQTRYRGDGTVFLADPERGNPFARLTRYESHLHRLFRRELADYLDLVRPSDSVPDQTQIQTADHTSAPPLGAASYEADTNAPASQSSSDTDLSESYPLTQSTGSSSELQSSSVPSTAAS